MSTEQQLESPDEILEPREGAATQPAIDDIEKIEGLVNLPGKKSKRLSARSTGTQPEKRVIPSLPPPFNHRNQEQQPIASAAPLCGVDWWWIALLISVVLIAVGVALTVGLTYK